MAGKHEVVLTSQNFDTEVIKSDKPVLVDFWAPWCGPCRFIAPVVEELAEEFASSAKIGKLNTDDYPEIAGQFGIRAIPTLFIFHKGQVVEQFVGVQSKGVLRDKLKYYAGAVLAN